MIEIDGSYGEGGGQILRVALFLSMALSKPFRIYNIRKGRKNPGLKRQHLNIIKTLLKISESKASAVQVGSTELEFHPGRLKGGKFEIDFKTAGSIPLYLQTLLPVLILLKEPLEITVKGGTDVPMGPTIDFVRYAFLPYIKKLGAKVSIEVIKRGYYPQGGGCVRIKADPASDPEAGALKIERSSLKSLKIFSVASKDLRSKKVAHRQLLSAQRFVEEKLGLKAEGFFEYAKAGSTGSSVTVVAEFEGNSIIAADALGAPGKPSEKVGKEAAKRFVDEFLSGADVDSHLADHLVALTALFGGSYRIPRETEHLKTAVWVANLFTPGSVRLEKNRVMGR